MAALQGSGCWRRTPRTPELSSIRVKETQDRCVDPAIHFSSSQLLCEVRKCYSKEAVA